MTQCFVYFNKHVVDAVGHAMRVKWNVLNLKINSGRVKFFCGNTLPDVPEYNLENFRIYSLVAFIERCENRNNIKCTM